MKSAADRRRGTRRATVTNRVSFHQLQLTTSGTPPFKELVLRMDLYGFLVSLVLSGLLAYSLWTILFKKSERPALRSVAILVLGDIGRSPRMMYHAESFANIGFETFLIGYGGRFPADFVHSVVEYFAQVHDQYRHCCPYLMSTFCISQRHRRLSKSCHFYSSLLSKYYCKYGRYFSHYWCGFHILRSILWSRFV